MHGLADVEFQFVLLNWFPVRGTVTCWSGLTFRYAAFSSLPYPATHYTRAVAEHAPHADTQETLSNSVRHGGQFRLRSVPASAQGKGEIDFA